MKKTGFIGAGNMGGALAGAVIGKYGGENVFVCRTTPERSAETAGKLGCRAMTAKEICSVCDFIFLGVKPQTLGQICASVRSELDCRKDGPVVVSMAAGVTVEKLSGMLGGVKIIRIMPNLPASTGDGTLLYCTSENVTEGDISEFLSLVSGAGTSLPVAEKLFDAASAISGCGPAFVYMFIDALSEGGVRCGLTKKDALALASLTVGGSAASAVKSGKHPDLLRDEVCSPAGSTVAGVSLLEERAFRAAVSDAVAASFERTKELGK